MQLLMTSFVQWTNITTIRFNQLAKTIRDAYETEFLTIYKALVNFINVDLSAFYLILPRMLVYIEGAKSSNAVKMQTVFYDILCENHETL